MTDRRKKRKQKTSFGIIYMLILIVLAVFAVFALFYVRLLLDKYESTQPERLVESLISELREDAADGTIWKKYTFPKVEYSKFESDISLEEMYANDLKSGEIGYSLKQGEHVGGGNLTYNITGKSDTVLAEVRLRAVGEPETKLAVFTIREWAIESFSIRADKSDYKIDAPETFTVTVNGIKLGADNVISSADGKVKYAAEGLYFAPNLEIRDESGALAEYKTAGKNVKTVYYDYSLTLPSALTVKLNGEVHTGVALDDGTVRHDIRTLKEPKVTIADLYNNEITYDGGSTIPLTYMTLKAPDTYTVKVDSLTVPEAGVKKYDNPDYEHFKAYVENLPKVAEYSIAVLKDGADISVTDKSGAAVQLDKSAKKIDLMEHGALDTVPEAISSSVNVLKVAEDWSFLMSDDLGGYAHGFYDFAKNLIEGSYLYDVAHKWVNSIDITFINYHSLGNPPFIDESVRNFRYITDKCFAVDISFGKQMILANGPMTDRMNCTFYFAWYDGTNDRQDNPSWKLVNYKEIVE